MAELTAQEAKSLVEHSKRNAELILEQKTQEYLNIVLDNVEKTAYQGKEYLDVLDHFNFEDFFNDGFYSAPATLKKAGKKLQEKLEALGYTVKINPDCAKFEVHW